MRLSVTNLQYHMHYFGADEMNANNSAPGSSRSLYYGVTSLPYALLDGGIKPSYIFDDFENITPNADQVKDQIESFGLAEIVAEIQPLGCIMAGDTGPALWKKRKEEELTPKQKRQIQHRAERRRTKQELGGEW